MAETLLEKEPKTNKEARRTNAAILSDRFAEGIEFAKKVGKTGSDAAEEFMDDTTQRIKRHPAETVVGAFAVGIILGGFMSWLFNRK